MFTENDYTLCSPSPHTGKLLRGGLLVALVFIMHTHTAPAQPVDIVVSIGEAVTNPGNSAEIPVAISTGASTPASLILFISYDASRAAPFYGYYENILVDNGQFLVDSMGIVMSEPAAVRREDAARNAGKQIAIEDHQGVVAVSVSGLNTGPIGNGLLFTLAFEVFEEASDNGDILLEGTGSDEEAVLADGAAASSASDGEGNSLPLAMHDGLIRIGCTPAPAPGNVTASQDESNGVTIAWDPVENGSEYRVYRSRTDDPGTALPIGNGWISATRYLDVTAEWSGTGTGCAGGNPDTQTWYYYWVKARTPEGCESAFSSPSASGYRTTPINLDTLINDIMNPEADAAAAAFLDYPGSGGCCAMLLLVIVLMTCHFHYRHLKTAEGSGH
jgi:hypothetical protein